MKNMLEDLTKPPAGDRSFFSDWGDPREYSLSDHGVGECAGEVVTPVEFELTAAEREVFEAQIAFENNEVEKARNMAYHAMLHAAKALVKIQKPDISDDPDQIVSEFRTRYFDTQKFWDPFAGGKFASYLFDAHAERQQALQRGRHALSDRRSAAFHRRGAQLQQQIELAGQRLVNVKRNASPHDTPARKCEASASKIPRRWTSSR